MRRIWITAFAYWFCASAVAAPAAGSEELLLGAGVHYSQGTYGTGVTTRITAVTFTGRYDTARWTFRGSVPYLFISGSNAVVPGIGRVGGATAAESSTSGLGDVALSATYAAYYDAATQFGVDVTGKIKVATADPDESLGTGEHDLGVLAEVYKVLGRLTVFAGLGYTEFGTTPRLAISDAVSYTLGASYRLDDRDSVGVSYDERERLASGAAPQKEITAFYARKIERGWRAQVYFLLGFADGSPDWGAGLSAAYPF
jgi:hypothetical protein